MAVVDPNLKYVVPLKGTGAAILATAITCGVISAPIVCLRTYTRLKERMFGWDDGLMLSGMIIYIVEIVLACEGAARGLGTPDARLNDFMQVEAKKYLMIWMMLYVGSLVLIKISICVTMLRVGNPMKILRVCVYLLLGLAVSTFIVTIVGILCLCRPVKANWNTALVLEGKAKCACMDAMIALSYMSTASSIATDMACAVLPGLIVWNIKMRRIIKISVCMLLSFGSLACITTMIRTPYIRYYEHPTDNLMYHVGNIVLWSNIETAIGLVAGSLPSLRLLIMRLIKKQDSDAKSTGMPRNGCTTHGLATFGSAPATGRKGGSRSYKNPTDLGTSVATVTRGDGDWRRLQDDGYDREQLKNLHGIRAEYTYEVELERSPEQNSERGSSCDSIIK